MAAIGDRHFEISLKSENYKTQFVSQKHAYKYTFDKCDLCLYKIIIQNDYCLDIVLIVRHYW